MTTVVVSLGLRVRGECDRRDRCVAWVMVTVTVEPASELEDRDVDGGEAVVRLELLVEDPFVMVEDSHGDGSGGIEVLLDDPGAWLVLAEVAIDAKEVEVRSVVERLAVVLVELTSALVVLL